MSSYLGRSENSDSTHSQNVRLKGRIVKQKMVHNAVAFLDTNFNDITVDTSEFIGDKLLIVKNTTGQSCNVTLYGNLEGSNQTYASFGSAYVVSGNGAASVLGRNVFGAALAGPVLSITVRVKFDTAPTSGSVTTALMGVEG